jgi:hypothetical protein
MDFDAIPHIEKFYKTPEQLRRMESYDQEQVSELISATSTRKTLDGTEQDNADNFIEIYEVHGLIDSRLLEDNPDLSIEDSEIKYIQQMHVVSFVQAKDGKYDDFTLYKGREAKDPYMITHLIAEEGRTLAIGAVEHLFDAQWMQNHSVKSIKDTLDIASKLIFQTSDTNYAGRNVLSAIETGDIFVHQPNAPLTRLANDKPDISAFMNFRQMWANLGQEVTSTPEAARGITPPSGTALGTVQIVTGQGLSLFEIMTENKGQHIEDMMREYVIPYLKKKMDTTDELVATLDQQSIAEIDSVYIPNKAAQAYNADVKKTLLAGGVPTPYDQQGYEAAVANTMRGMGNKRVFKPSEIDEASWKDALKDFEWRVNVEVTNENVDKQVVLQTLSSILQTVASNPAILQDPNAKMIFSTILSETGRISPLQLSATQALAAQPAQPTPPTQMSGQPPPTTGVETAQLLGK